MRKKLNILKILFFSFLICVLIFALYFHNNAEALYCYLGNYYAKHNNINKAIEYYEKSYNMGNKDPKFRTSYINVLINSPLSISSQEKIVKFANSDIKDSASESAKYFLYNLKREIHNKYPENYIKQASYNGQIIHWGKMPITYTFKNTRGVPTELVDAVNSAFDEWERVSSARIRFEKISMTPNADIVVTFTGRKYTKTEFGKKYVIAYTVPSVSQNKLDKMNMEFNVFDIEGKLFTPTQMYNTALHEIFHALGFMGHSYNSKDIMYMSSEQDDIENNVKKFISNADKVTLELLYKIKPDITNADELKYNYVPYLIMGNNAEVNYAKKTEAKNYIKKAPTVPAGYIDLAHTFVNQKEYTKAIACLDKALNLADSDAIRYLVYYNLAVTHYYDGSFELSQLYIDKARELKDDKELYLLEAEVFVKQDNIKGAIDKYKYLIKTSPNDIDLAINLSNLYIKNHNYLEARKVLKDYLKQNPNDKTNKKLSPYKLLIF